jgi:hypothetical protein
MVGCRKRGDKALSTLTFAVNIREPSVSCSNLFTSGIHLTYRGLNINYGHSNCNEKNLEVLTAFIICGKVLIYQLNSYVSKYSAKSKLAT